MLAALTGAVAVLSGCAIGSDNQLWRLAPDLPLSITAGAEGPGRAFVVFISGDGGWGPFDSELARGLARSGLPVVGWDARRYFRAARTPASAAADLARVIESYGARFRRDRVLLVGFSFGANAMPFMAERLPERLRQRIAGVTLISPTTEAQFQFSLLDWIFPRGGGLAVAPAVARLDPARTLCVYGLRDRGTLCPRLPQGVSQTLPRPGGHHLSGGNDATLIRAIVGIAGRGSELASKKPRDRARLSMA